MENRILYPARIIFIILSLAVMVIIFIFSSENAEISSDTSGGITEFVIHIMVDGYEEMSSEEQEEIYGKYDHIVRKLAHFTVYTALGFCVSCAAGKRKIISKYSAVPPIICFIYACSDEIHQTFVDGRAGRFTDVLIDTSGGVTGMFISFLFMAIFYAGKRKTAASIVI